MMNYLPKSGDIIKMRAWHGIVLDVFQNEMGQTVLRVQTVRNIFRKLGPELIEIDIAPNQITPATREDLLNEIALHQKMQKEVVEQFLDNLEKMPTLTAEKV
jgi:Zn-dependent M32 family carboxypeptidase